jgi:hypothetical protein
MCTYYLGRALQECLAAVNAQDYQKVCDLDRGWRTMILLGSALTSFAMLGFKLAHIQVVRMQFSEQQRMEREREELIAELEQTVSADVAGKVGGILKRRSSVGAGVLLPAGIHPGLPGLEGYRDPSVLDDAEDGKDTEELSEKQKRRKSISWKGDKKEKKEEEGKMDKIDKGKEGNEVEFLSVRPEPSQAPRANPDLDAYARVMLSQDAADSDYITFLEDESDDPRLSESPPLPHFTRQPASAWGVGYQPGERITRGSFTGTVVEY